MRPIISVHVPKSGGTSVKADLDQQFGPRALFDYGRGPLGPQRDAIENGLPAGIDLVHGHFRPGRYDAAGAAFRLTFLRQPVDLLFSFYFFWRTMPYQGLALHRRFLDEAPTLEAFAGWEPVRRLTSQTIFGGYDMDRFDFIGFHESRAPDMLRLNAIAGLELKPDRRENTTIRVGDERGNLEGDTGLRARLSDLLLDDIHFYDRLRERHGA